MDAFTLLRGEVWRDTHAFTVGVRTSRYNLAYNLVRDPKRSARFMHAMRRGDQRVKPTEEKYI